MKKLVIFILAIILSLSTACENSNSDLANQILADQSLL